MHLPTGRIDHADQPDEYKVFLQFFCLQRLCLIGDIPFHAIGHPQHAQSIPGHLVIGIQDALAQFLIELFRFIVHGLVA